MDMKYEKMTSDLYRVSSMSTLGTGMYLISRSYALRCLKKLDSYNSMSNEKSSVTELIVNNSNGCLTVPMLAIKDCIDSDVPVELFRQQLDNFGLLNYKQFNLADLRLEIVHYIVSSDIANITNLLTHVIDGTISAIETCHKQGQHKTGVKLGNFLYNQYLTEKVPITPSKLSSFLDNYYVNAFYYDKNLALEIAKFYVKKIRTDKDFYNVFSLNEKHIRKNFSYLRQDLFNVT